MEHQVQAPNQNDQDISQSTNLFNDVFDLAPYEKSMKNARIWLYVIAGIQFIVGIVEYSTIDEKTIAAIAFAIDAGVAVLFLLLALWSRKSPTIAFTLALVLYGIVVIGGAFLDASNIYKGILVKIFVIIALIKANRDARKFEEAKRTLGQ